MNKLFNERKKKTRINTNGADQLNDPSFALQSREQTYISGQSDDFTQGPWSQTGAKCVGYYGLCELYRLAKRLACLLDTNKCMSLLY